MAKKRTLKSHRTKTARTENVCRLRALGDVEIPLRDQSGGKNTFARLAVKWSEIVKARAQWSKSKARIQRLTTDAISDLAILGVNRTRLEQLADSPVIEVSMPFVNEEFSWPARILPWEFLLSRATREHRRDGDEFLVVRHIETAEVFKPAPDPRSSLVFIETNPGPFRRRLDFSDEKRLLRARFAGDSSPDGTPTRTNSFRHLNNPSLEKIASSIPGHGAVHLSGVTRLLHERRLQDIQIETSLGHHPRYDRDDGLFLTSELGDWCITNPEDLAKKLTECATPEIVTFNTYSSAARLAALCVAHGAGAALGFQDDFDPAAAEQFYGVFYANWVDSQPLLTCFRRAFRSMWELRDLQRGSGVVLWSRVPLVASWSDAPGYEPIVERLSDEAAIRSNIRFQIVVPPKLNYSRLHNLENLFATFWIYNYSPKSIEGLDVDVRLALGADSFSFEQQVDLNSPITVLERMIRVALRWDQVKHLRESVMVTLHVHVRHRDMTLFRNTYSSEFVPVDEWVDDEQSGPWLPSFVFPRDEAVSTVITRAQKYLRVLVDDSSAGFDGYQLLNGSLKISEDRIEVVDSQARAIWYSLIHDTPLYYINPPPTYTAGSQRLRRPGKVIHSGQGTCIDLALLYAACLEYIGLHPVIFLLKGHALPGYWRVERTLEDEDFEVADSVQYPWWSGAGFAAEIKHLIQTGELVPIETVHLTNRGNFNDAVLDAEKTVTHDAEFHSLIDVVTARRYEITPLPL